MISGNEKTITVYNLWDEKTPYPDISEIPTINKVEYSLVHAQTEDYKFLHEPRMAFHGDTLFISFSNAPETEAESAQIIRGRRSRDNGRTWSEPEVIAPGSPDGDRHETAPMLSLDGTLWAFIGRFGPGPNYGRNSLGMELYFLDKDTGHFQAYSKGLILPGFIPFVHPQHLDNGNWIIGGHMDKVQHAAAAISNGNDLTQWELVKIETPAGVDFPETALLLNGNEVLAVTRNRAIKKGNQELKYALMSYSHDFGKSFIPAMESNLPMSNSKPFCGKLSNGQYYIVYNACQTTDVNPRNALLIAATRPGEMPPFCRVWKVIEGTPDSIAPIIQSIGSKTGAHSWAYPEAVEKDGVLYLTFSNDGRHCWLARIPTNALKIKATRRKLK